MIEIKELKPSDKGRVVKYKSTVMPGDYYEYGKITSWNEEYIFVDYHNHQRGTPTRPLHLTFVDNVELHYDRNNKLTILNTVNLDELTDGEKRE